MLLANVTSGQRVRKNAYNVGLFNLVIGDILGYCEEVTVGPFFAV